MKPFRLIMTFFLFFSLSSLLLFCKKKDDKLTISGIAFDQQVGHAVSGMKVELLAKTITNGTWSTQYSSIATQTTKSDGNFSFKFDNIRVSEFKLSFSKTSYFLDEYIISPDLVETGGDYHNTYSVHSEAWLKISIKNNTPASVDDILSYRIKDGAISCQNGCSDSFKYLNGANVDTSSICKLYGSQKAVIEWNYSNNQNHQQHFDTVWIQPADTTLFNINY